MRILITGSAGFIGFHVAGALLDAGHAVDGIDALTAYYDVALKRRRHRRLAARPGFTVHVLSIEDAQALDAVARDVAPDIIIHLAAQAGVRHSLDNPRAYLDSNIVGTFNVLEVARRVKPRHLLIASTSSVYGANVAHPFREDDRTDQPLSFYAATKKAVEAMAHSYAHLHAIPTTVLRFFTVYGPWGRPDMAPFRFLEAILNGKPIDLYNHGEMYRDFTYVGDLTEALVRLVGVVPGDRDGPRAGLRAGVPYRVVNIGNSTPVHLGTFIDAIERSAGRRAIRNPCPMPPGEVPSTFASTDLLVRLTGFRPSTRIVDGVDRFVAWYKEYARLDETDLAENHLAKKHLADTDLAEAHLTETGVAAL